MNSSTPLFNRSGVQPTKTELINHLKELSDEAEKLRNSDPITRLEIDQATVLRNRLKELKHDIGLQEVSKKYPNDKYYQMYYRALSKATSKTVGRLTQRNFYDFLFDVSSYIGGLATDLENSD